ncbi:MAG: site-specific integrase, partial [Acholeplasma sp.]|nr:site-specific integrase [Acholeplasma sp.]
MKYIIKDYELYLEKELGLSSNTISAYKNDIDQCLVFLNKYHKIDKARNIKKINIVNYLNNVRKKYSSSTYARKLTAIKSLFKFLA